MSIKTAIYNKTSSSEYIGRVVVSKQIPCVDARVSGLSKARLRAAQSVHTPKLDERSIQAYAEDADGWSARLDLLQVTASPWGTDCAFAALSCH